MRYLSAISVPALLVALASPAFASDEEQDRAVALSPVIVTGERSADAASLLSTAPREVLDGRALERDRAPTLGQTLARIPGVQNSGFGPSAGRPEVRGQAGPRVALVVNGMQSRDASALSGDHAAPIEPFLADRIDVLKGPAAVLYGGSAIGGAIEVTDGRIPMTVPADDFSGRAQFSGGYNSDLTAMVRLDGGRNEWAWHVDALYRDRPDLRIPGGSKADACRSWADLVSSVDMQTLCQVRLATPVWVRDPQTGRWVDGTPPERQIITDRNPGADGRLPNSAQTTTAFTLGGSRIATDGYFGASVQHYASDYGVPGFAYITSAHPQPSPIDLEVELTRYDFRAGFYPRALGVDRVDIRLMSSESDDREVIDGAVHTRLINQADDFRVDVTHTPWLGLTGVVGLHASRRDLTTEGAKAYLPSVAMTEDGVFWAEQFVWRDLTIKGGLRHDRIVYNVDEATIRDGRGLGSLARDRSFNTTNASISARYDLPFGLYAEARYDSAERAPSLIEMYANGDHFGILTEEQGDSRLDIEKAENVEFGLGLRAGRYSLTANAYRTDYENYIYLGNTGVSRTLPVREWRQGDTLIEGLEVQASVRFDATPWGDFELSAFGDQVESKPRFTLPDGYSPFTSSRTTPAWDKEYFRRNLDGDFLPRMPVSRYGAEVVWALGPWNAALGAVHHEAQDKTAKNEARSKAYTLVDAHLAYALEAPGGQWEAFVDASNLLDEEARPHNSFLRYRAPLGGRAVTAGVRVAF
ncbi:TonB-dependent receptor [Brevundimonas sp. GCM10030266]|uniref:TonB-dependent receptor n=1 Tax=Brevundimonas sp. GCM10030266 TaxID=3273386 RepID=UPI003606463F